MFLMVVCNYNSNFKQYDKMHFQVVFTWDICIGFEINICKNAVLFMNFDIYNVLNIKNKIVLS